MHIMKRWMHLASHEQKQQLAKLANTSVGTLQQIAGGYRNGGKINTTPDLARRVEVASSKMVEVGLPEIPRESLCQACGRCELAKQARG